MKYSGSPRNAWRPWIWLTAAASLLLVAAWFGYAHLVAPQEPADGVSSASVRIYNSLDRLSEVSDAVVIGEVIGIASTQADTGVDGLATAIPSTWYEVEVQEVLKGEATDTIHVVRTNPGHFRDGNVSTFETDEILLLYLMKRTSTEFPLVTVADVFYVPVSFDNGVFDVVASPTGAAEDTRIQPRISNLFGKDSFTKVEVEQAASAR